MKTVDRILLKLSELISQRGFEEQETDLVEIKSVPSDSGGWKELHKSVNAFLNTRGGIVILGVAEREKDGRKWYDLTGWRPEMESKIKELANIYTDRTGQSVNVQDALPLFSIEELLHKRVGVLYVDELPSERKYCFYQGEAYVRRITGDHRLKSDEIDRHEEIKEELATARELTVIDDAVIEDLDLDRLNEYIALLNRQIRVESLKPTLELAMPFLNRKSFVIDGKVTTLGLLVCGRNPEDRLNFRSQIHGYVQSRSATDYGSVGKKVADDRKIIVGNVLPLMEGALNFIYQNIQVEIRTESGGIGVPEYPDEVLRETVNNAIAHRDYSIDRYVSITISPGSHIEIRNPGSFRRSQLIEDISASTPIRRIIPDPKPRNPKLAQVLMVYNKWEGRGIGMATLTNLSLNNQIDLPCYRFYTESDVGLFLYRGKLLDDEIEQLLKSFDRYVSDKLGRNLNTEEALVLAYVIKSERANERHLYTVTLTPDNNHFDALRGLESVGLLRRHPSSPTLHPIYLVDPVLVAKGYREQLEAVFSSGYASLDEYQREVLNVVFRHNEFSTLRAPSARTVAFTFYFTEGRKKGDVREFDRIYRKVKIAVNKLEKAGYLVREKKGRGFVINSAFLSDRLL